MPESSNYPSIIALPSVPRAQQINIPSAVKDLQLWAADLSRALANQFNAISKPLREGKLTPGPHASSHFPQTGLDPLATAVHDGGYGTTAAAGIADSLLRSDARFVYPEALATALDRTKTLLVTDDSTYSALLTAAGAFGGGSAFPGGAGKGLSLLAPGGTFPFVVGPNGTMGRGTYNDQDLMFHSGVSISHASRVHGWNLASLTATGTGGVTGIEGSALDTPSSNSTQAIRGIDFTARAAGVNANGPINAVKGTIGSYSGTSASRGAAAVFQAVGPLSLINQTLPSFYYYEAGPAGGVPIGGTLTLIVGFKQTTAFSSGTTKRGVQVINSLECTANDAIFSTAAKGPVMKDTQATPEFWRLYVSATGLKDATYSMDATEAVTVARGASATGTVTLNIQDVGTAAPTT